MQINMTFKHMDSTEAIKSHAKEKSEKLSKFINDKFEAKWVFFVDSDVHVAELSVQGPHIDLFAEAKTENLYHSIDEALAKMEKQLIKHKEIVKNHLHR